MPSKYFVPHKEDLEFDTVVGQFPCQQDDCESGAVMDTAQHFKKADRLVWTCDYGHRSQVKASDYV